LNVMKMAIETYVNVHLTEGGDVATVPVGVWIHPQAADFESFTSRTRWP
jgi:hypothetical protein